MRTIPGLVAAFAASMLVPIAAAQSIVPISGNGAVVAPGASTTAVVFEVRGAGGNPIPGVTVTFEEHCMSRMRGDAPPYACVTGPGPSPTAVSDGSGRVSSPPYTADLMTGNAWVMVTAVVETRIVNLPFYWTIGFSPRNPIQIVSGDNQIVQTGFTAQPLLARVLDDFARPIQGVPVAFASNCSSLPCLQPPAASATARLTSDAFGYVDSGARVANNVTGAYDVVLSLSGVFYGTNFRITNVPPMRTATSRTKTGAEAFLRMVEGPAACSITRMQPLNESLVARAPNMLAIPEGLIEISIDNCPAGAKLSFSLQHPGGFPEGAKLWAARPTWQALTSSNTIEGFWEFTITDGAAGDADATANGSIQMVLAIGFGDVVNPNFQDLWWAGFEENGWGVSIVQHRDVLFVVIFAYDAAGQPTWYVMPGGTWNATHNAYTGVIYSPRGRPLNEHVAANLVMGSPVGTMTLIFSDSMSMRALVTIGGKESVKFLERQLFGPRDTRVVGRMDDMWWAGVQRNGWGLVIHQQYASLFNVLFTYGPDGKPIWYPMPSGTWTAPNVWEGSVYRTGGPVWPTPYDPGLLVTERVGAFKLDFANGAATFNFSAEGRTSNFPIQRMGF